MALTRANRAALIALTVYLVALALVLLWPTPVDRLLPRSIWVVLWHARRVGLEWVTFSAVEITANVLLFIPFGVLMVLVLPARRWWVAPIAPIVVSCLAEVAQRVLLPERVPSLVDVAANTGGALIGVAIGMVATRRRRGRTDGRG